MVIKKRNGQDPGLVRRATKAVLTVRSLRMEKRRIEDGIDTNQQEAIEAMKAMHVTNFALDDPDHDDIKIAATVVQQSTLIFDEAKLKRAVGPNVWKAITKVVLDRTLLEQAVAEGKIKPETVAACAEEKPSKPFIRITEKRG